MAFIKTTPDHKATILNVWKITKVNNETIFVETENPFEKQYTNGYIDIIDIFNRRILINSVQCIDMLLTKITKIELNNKTDFYEGTPDIRTNYTCSDDYATPIKPYNTNNICR